MIADAPAPTVSAPARKHQNYDRELSDRERKLVDAWHDPKKRRAELTSLIWQRDMSYYFATFAGVLMAGSLCIGAVAAIQYGMGWHNWLFDTSVPLLLPLILIFQIARSTVSGYVALQEQVAALKYIGQLEDRSANMEPPASE